MATLDNTAYTINPLLRTTSSPSVFQGPISGSTPGAKQYASGGQATMVPPTVPNLNIASPTPTPTGETVAQTYARAQAVSAGLPPVSTATTTPPTKEPTIAESLGPLTYEKNPTFEEIYGKEQSQEELQRQQLKLFQGQIDATNAIYDQMLNQARMEGQGRLGSQRAMAARGGLLGSDFGASQKEKVIGYNTDINRAIQAERLAKVGEIMGEVRSAVTAQRAEDRAARQQGAENWLAHLKNQSTTRQGNLNLAASAMLSRGIDPTTMDENELAAIAKEAGVSTADLITQYRTLANEQASATAESDLKTRKTEAEIAKIEADIADGKIKTIGEGTMLYNTETGETFKNPKTYAPTAASGLKIGGNALNQEAVADVHQTLNESRGKDGYANTDLYMQQFNGFVALGGDPKDFIKEYDPNVYINPKDETRSFLQTAMKTTPAEAVQKELTALEQLQQLQEMQANQ